MTKDEKKQLIENANLLFYAVEPSKSHMSYKLCLLTDTGKRIESGTRIKGSANIFYYFFYEFFEDQEWSNAQKRKAILVNDNV